MVILVYVINSICKHQREDSRIKQTLLIIRLVTRSFDAKVLGGEISEIGKGLCKKDGRTTFTQRDLVLKNSTSACKQIFKYT